MGALPEYLLVHTVTVEPYQGVWGSYGAARTVRCMLQETANSSPAQAGATRANMLSFWTRLGEDVPAGSRIVLPDGRVGYAASATRKYGGGLPTPDHLKVFVYVAADSYGPAFGETVTLMSKAPAYRDRQGNTRYATTATDVPGCGVRLLSQTEVSQGRSDQTVDTVEVIAPPGTVATAVDMVRVRGLDYLVDGTPGAVTDSSTGADAGVRIVGKRVRG